MGEFWTVHWAGHHAAYRKEPPCDDTDRIGKPAGTEIDLVRELSAAGFDIKEFTGVSQPWATDEVNVIAWRRTP
jgi:hypothetical protein